MSPGSREEEVTFALVFWCWVDGREEGRIPESRHSRCKVGQCGVWWGTHEEVRLGRAEGQVGAGELLAGAGGAFTVGVWMQEGLCARGQPSHHTALSGTLQGSRPLLGLALLEGRVCRPAMVSRWRKPAVSHLHEGTPHREKGK